MTFHIAFICTAGSCRGHIAKKLAQQLAPADVEVINLSTTAQPPLPQAVEVMQEIGLDISDQKSLGMEDLTFRPLDLVIELCPKIAVNRSVLPGIPSVLRWNLPDPFEVDESERLKVVREIRNILQDKIEDFFENGYFEALRVHQRNQQLALDDFPDAILTHDANRKITWVNRAAERIIGYDRNELIGNDCFDIFPEKFCSGHCNHCETASKSTNRLNYPIKITAKNGQQRYIDMSVVQMLDEHDVFQGVMTSFRDVTEVTNLRHQLKSVKSFHGIIGSDSKMQTVYELIRDVAVSDCAVLIQGESGTGKELVAMAIHGESSRFDKPLVTVNCAALPENILESELFGHVRGAFTGAIRDKKGRFELADGGTLFLDEVGELAPNIQIKLLRVLQEHTFEPVGGDKTISVNVRVISATNRHLRDMVHHGQFREDLYYRLCVVPVNLPPLRERRTDIAQLVDHFIKRFRHDANTNIVDISLEAMEVLIDYDWPGNIRELQNALQYAFVKCKGDILQKEHLPQEILAEISQAPTRRSVRKRKLTQTSIKEVLQETGGNKLQAARKLGVGRATLYRYLNNPQT